jgi:hypothetical protein
MGKRKHRYELDLDVSATTSSASSSTHPHPTEQILRETSHIRTDGTVRRVAQMVDAPTSPSKLSAPLLFDEPLAQRGTAPIYDLYDQPDDFDDGLGVDDGLGEGESGHEMRDSVGSYPFGVRETHQSIYQDHPLREWVRENREIFLVELLRGEGRGDHRHYSVCPACAVSAALYHCKTCVGGDELLCQGCIVDRHAQSPFHLIEVRIFFP